MVFAVRLTCRQDVVEFQQKRP